MVREIDARQLQAMLAGGDPVYLLDVREPWEHDKAALPGSKLIPLNELTSRHREIALPAGALMVVYCHHGIRSRAAATVLQRLSYEPIASLAGGIDAWSVSVDATLPRY